MSVTIVAACSMALVWMLLTNQFNLQGFGLGMILGTAILLLVRQGLGQGKVNWRRLPGQILALVYYLLILYRDVILSALDIARRVLSPDMRLKPGVVAVPVQDPTCNELVAAFSADAISLTPGELVVDLQDHSVMYVHTLDVERTAANAAAEQARRLKLFNRILGRD